MTGKRFFLLLTLFAFLLTCRIVILIVDNASINMFGLMAVDVTGGQADSLELVLENINIPYDAAIFSRDMATVSAGYQSTDAAVYQTSDNAEIFIPSAIAGTWPQSGQAILSHQTAIILFADEDCIGKTITVSGMDYMVSGVISSLDSVLALGKTEKHTIILYAEPSAHAYALIRTRPSNVSLLSKRILDDLALLNVENTRITNLDSFSNATRFMKDIGNAVFIILLTFLMAGNTKKTSSTYRSTLTILLGIIAAVIFIKPPDSFPLSKGLTAYNTAPRLPIWASAAAENFLFASTILTLVFIMLAITLFLLLRFWREKQD